MPPPIVQVEAVLKGEAPVAASLRRRLPENVLQNGHSNMTSSLGPEHAGIGNCAENDDFSVCERPASRASKGDMSVEELPSAGGAAGTGGAGNGGLEAMEGSLIEGSGKALIRNGRIHLLEWRPIVDRRVEYDDIAPDARSVNSFYSDSPYSDSPYWSGGAEAGRRWATGNGVAYAVGAVPRGSTASPAFPNDRRRDESKLSRIDPSVSVSFMDHVKVREAAQEWLSAQVFSPSLCAGTSMLHWMVCRCFLGWSASSHELENARYRRVMRTGSETSERCTDTASSRYGGANGRQRLVCSPRNVRCNARYAVLPLSASQEACLRRRCRRDLFPFPASPLLSHLDDEVATR